MYIRLLISIWLLTIANTAWAIDLYVPHGPGLVYPNIQSAINAASDDDVVIIQPGVYTGPGNRDMDFLGKAITVQSIDPNDPNVISTTVIDCEHDLGHRGFYFHHNEEPNSIIAGLTIKRGFIEGNDLFYPLYRGGAGILCVGASPTIQNCVITDNKIRGKLFHGSPGGAGIYCDENSNPIIINCVISQNVIKGTMEPGCEGHSVYGAGVYTSYNSHATLINCGLFHNHLIPGFHDDRFCTVYDCFSDIPESTSAGGAIYGPATINHCTFVGNIALQGGAVYMSNLTSITNSIFWDHQGDDIAGSGGSITYSSLDEVVSGIGNIAGDPLFVSGPLGDYYLSQLASGDSQQSSCVDAGSDLSTNLTMDHLTTRRDHVGDAGQVDMGYHPVSPIPDLIEPIVYRYVPGGGSPSYPNIQDAIDDAIDGNIIVVQPGTYTGVGNYNINFRGKSITVRSLNGPDDCIIDCQNISGRRGFIFHENEDPNSLLSGFTIRGGNIKSNCQYYDVANVGAGIFCTNASPTIDNCVVTQNNISLGGYFVPSAAFGAGIYCGQNSRPYIRNTIISHNTGHATTAPGAEGDDAKGGGIYIDGTSHLTMFNCLVTNNSVVPGSGQLGAPDGVSYGGGLYGSASIYNCTFLSNTAMQGAGIYMTDPSSVINSIFWNHGADDVAGFNGNITYSCLEEVVAGVGNIFTDPLFVSGQNGELYLSQITAGQHQMSPCVNAGSDLAAHFGLDGLTTSTDFGVDDGQVDLGYHYPVSNIEYLQSDLNQDSTVNYLDYGLWQQSSLDSLLPKILHDPNIVVDGDLSDWAGSQWSQLDQIYEGDPNDIEQAQFSLRWSENNNKIYAAVVVTDLDHVFLDTYIAWNASDRLEVYCQGDASGGSGWYNIYDKAQHYYIAPNTTSSSWARWALGQLINPSVGLEYAVNIIGNEIHYELAVTPFNHYAGLSTGLTEVTDLDFGKIIRFDLVALSRFSGGYGMLSENLNLGKYNNASQFARYVLADELGCANVLGDFDVDCDVDLADLQLFITNWLWGTSGG